MTAPMGWTVTLEATGTPVNDVDRLAGQLTTLTDLLESESAATTCSPVGERYTVMLSLAARDGDPLEVALVAHRAVGLLVSARVAAGLPDWPIVNVHVRTFEEQDLEAHPFALAPRAAQ